jgi:hypothetical protein
MAHFSQLDTNNIVTNVIVINNNELLDQDGNEIEQKGIDFCKTLFGQDTKWVQTSYNGNFRKNYAGIGYAYDKTLDAFIPPKPYNSWLLDETIAQWKAPVDYPTDDKRYTWNEETLAWDVINDN